MVAFDFNAANHEPAKALEPVPEDWYNVVIEKSEMKETASKNGAFLQMVLNIIDGDFAGRKLWVRLNLQNPNEQAVQIASEQLSAICYCTGVMQLNDTSALHNIPFKAKAIKVISDGKTQNEVKGFQDINGNEPGAQTGASGQAQTQTNNANWGANAEAQPDPNATTTQPPTPPQAETPPAANGLTMTEKANGVTYEAFVKQGWTDSAMIEQGYAASAPQAPPASAEAPSAPHTPANALSGAASGNTPPWAK